MHLKRRNSQRNVLWVIGHLYFYAGNMRDVKVAKLFQAIHRFFVLFRRVYKMCLFLVQIDFKEHFSVGETVSRHPSFLFTIIDSEIGSVWSAGESVYSQWWGTRAKTLMATPNEWLSTLHAQSSCSGKKIFSCFFSRFLLVRCDESNKITRGYWFVKYLPEETYW